MQNVNLMPPGYAQKERAKRRLVLGGGVLVALILVMVGLAKLTDKWIRSREEANAIVARDVEDLTTAKADLASCNRRLEMLARKLLVVRLLDRNRRWATCLAAIARAAHDQIVLSRIRIQPARRPVDDSGGARDPKAAAPAPGSAAPGTRPPARQEDLSHPERLVLLLQGYAVSNTDVTLFITALNATGWFERVTWKGSEAARLGAREVSRFELECPLRYTPARPAVPERRIAAPVPVPPGEALVLSGDRPAKGGEPR